ncbi:hypothetical protein ACH5RR_039060 [Cinchona calisaya]|uniref:Protein SAMBA n=1 Tax=Cinchona calisaya TaxID=153742 RepID=A0ABD2Y2B3_9GENT
MSNSSLSSSSPARSSSTAIGGGNAAVGVAGSSLSVEDYHFSADLNSIQDLNSILERKDEALLFLKADLMVALNKEVKSLDEDNWMFEGPRSRIHLISRPGGLLHKRFEITKHHNFGSRK